MSGLIIILLSLNGYANKCEEQLDSCIVAHDDCVEDYNDCYKRLQKSTKMSLELIHKFEVEQNKIEAENATKFYKGLTWGSVGSTILWGIIIMGMVLL